MLKSNFAEWGQFFFYFEVCGNLRGHNFFALMACREIRYFLKRDVWVFNFKESWLSPNMKNRDKTEDDEIYFFPVKSMLLVLWLCSEVFWKPAQNLRSQTFVWPVLLKWAGVVAKVLASIDFVFGKNCRCLLSAIHPAIASKSCEEEWHLEKASEHQITGRCS